MTLTIVSSEPLSKAPVVHVTQPGTDAWDATSTRVGRRTYRVTLTLSSAGDAGTLVLDVAGIDRYGAGQDTSLSLPLR